MQNINRILLIYTLIQDLDNKISKNLKFNLIIIYNYFRKIFSIKFKLIIQFIV